MKPLALILASLALAPLFAAIGHGARLEHWPTIAAASGALALVFGCIRYFT